LRLAKLEDTDDEATKDKAKYDYDKHEQPTLEQEKEHEDQNDASNQDNQIEDLLPSIVLHSNVPSATPMFVSISQCFLKLLRK
jgi:hypothetical protein